MIYDISINCSQGPLMYMIYPCISLPPIRHPNKWAIAKLSFHDVRPLCKSHKFTYPNECSGLFTCFFALQQYIFIEFQILISENI